MANQYESSRGYVIHPERAKNPRETLTKYYADRAILISNLSILRQPPNSRQDSTIGIGTVKVNDSIIDGSIYPYSFPPDVSVQPGIELHVPFSMTPEHTRDYDPSTPVVLPNRLLHIANDLLGDAERIHTNNPSIVSHIQGLGSEKFFRFIFPDQKPEFVIKILGREDNIVVSDIDIMLGDTKAASFRQLRTRFAEQAHADQKQLEAAQLFHAMQQTAGVIALDGLEQDHKVIFQGAKNAEFSSKFPLLHGEKIYIIAVVKRRGARNEHIVADAHAFLSYDPDPVATITGMRGRLMGPQQFQESFERQKFPSWQI